MNLLDRIKSDLRESLLKKESERVSILRIILSSVKNLEIEKGKPLSDSELISIFKSEIKKIKDSIFEFSKAGREDLVKKEKKYLAILEQYMPEQMSKEEIREVIKEFIRKASPTEKDYGRLMSKIMGAYKDKVDGATVSNIVREILLKGDVGKD